jgi:Ca2+-binding EF-hand superfamily protein
MQDFALGLSILVKGSEEDKLRWTFNMYDLNGDGVITRDEMEDVVASVKLIDSTWASIDSSSSAEHVFREKISHQSP